MKTDASSALDVALAAKGIGPKGLKPLTAEQLEAAVAEMTQEKAAPVGAAFLTGFRVLERDPEQCQALLGAYQGHREELSAALQFLFEAPELAPKSDVEAWITKLFQRVDLDASECAGVVEALLSESVDEVYKVALLQGLRVKRETDEENEALFQGLFERAERRTWSGPCLLDLSQPYDGMTRNPDLSLELAALLSLVDLPVVIHASRGLGPKYGETVLSRWDESTSFGFEKALKGLESLGVAIVDQSHAFPALHALKDMRNAMKKRPFLATVEKMMMPIQAERNVLVTGYVHSAYKTAIPEMLKRVNRYDEMVLLKGLEGATYLHPSKKTPFVHLKNGTWSEGECEALELGELDDSLSVSGPWWSCEKHPLRASLLRSASQIAGLVLGESSGPSILSRMKVICNDGLLSERLDRLDAYYSEVTCH